MPPFYPSSLPLSPKGLVPLYASRKGYRGGESKLKKRHSLPHDFALTRFDTALPLSHFERGGKNSGVCHHSFPVTMPVT